MVAMNSRAESRRMMRAERADLRRLFGELTSDQLGHASLCAGWTVQELAAHLLAWDDLLLYRTPREHLRALLRFATLYLRSFASMDRLNRRLAKRAGALGWETVAQRFGAEDDPALKWLFDGTNANAHLAEYVIHHQDIRRALDLPRTIPCERLLAALDGVTNLPSVRWPAWRKLRRRRWLAADIGWARGRGPVVAGSGEAILMALAGRAQLRTR